MNTPVQQSTPVQLPANPPTDFIADLTPKEPAPAVHAPVAAPEPATVVTEPEAAPWEDQVSIEDLLDTELPVKSTSDFSVTFRKEGSTKKLKGSTEASKYVISAAFAFTRTDAVVVDEDAPKKPGRKPAKAKAPKEVLHIQFGDDFTGVATDFIDFLHGREGGLDVEVSSLNISGEPIEAFTFSGCTLEDRPQAIKFSERDEPEPRILDLFIRYEDLTRETVQVAE